LPYFAEAFAVATNSKIILNSGHLLFSVSLFRALILFWSTQACRPGL
jgi:hypothetical protein